jgi:Flp pilus assembly protein TadG
MSGGLRAAVRRRIESTFSQRGAVAVEFGLVLPVLIVLLVGTVTAGLAYSRSIGLANAVREGARLGATSPISSPGDWAKDVIARTRQTQFDDGADEGSSNTSVCVELRGSTTIAPVCSTGALGSSAAPVIDPALNSDLWATGCVVVVYAARHFEIITGISAPLTGDITKQSVARYEGTC